MLPGYVCGDILCFAWHAGLKHHHCVLREIGCVGVLVFVVSCSPIVQDAHYVLRGIWCVGLCFVSSQWFMLGLLPCHSECVLRHILYSCRVCLAKDALHVPWECVCLHVLCLAVAQTCFTDLSGTVFGDLHAPACWPFDLFAYVYLLCNDCTVSLFCVGALHLRCVSRLFGLRGRVLEF